MGGRGDVRVRNDDQERETYLVTSLHSHAHIPHECRKRESGVKGDRNERMVRHERTEVTRTFIPIRSDVEGTTEWKTDKPVTRCSLTSSLRSNVDAHSRSLHVLSWRTWCSEWRMTRVAPSYGSRSWWRWGNSLRYEREPSTRDRGAQWRVCHVHERSPYVTPLVSPGLDGMEERTEENVMDHAQVDGLILNGLRSSFFSYFMNLLSSPTGFFPFFHSYCSSFHSPWRYATCEESCRLRWCGACLWWVPSGFLLRS